MSFAQERAGPAAPRLTAAALPPELGRAWAAAWPSWFGPARVGLPRAPEKERLALVETPLGRVVAKRARPRVWKLPLEALGARRSRSERAFRLAETLRGLGLATPEPLAVLSGRGETILVTRFVEGRGLFAAWGEPGASAALLQRLAQDIARLHAMGFRHRDLKAPNLLVSGPAEALELVWTDLDGLQRAGTVERRLRARDLARLGASFESSAARAAGVRAGDWPALVRRYLELALPPGAAAEELDAWLGWTKRWRERWVRAHLARGKPLE